MKKSTKIFLAIAIVLVGIALIGNDSPNAPAQPSTQSITYPTAQPASYSATNYAVPNPGTVVSYEEACFACHGTGSCQLCYGTGTYRAYGVSVPCDRICTTCDGAGVFIRSRIVY